MSTDVRLRFIPMMNIAVGEAVILKLPFFSGQSKTNNICNTITVPPSSSVCFNATWVSNQAESELRIIFDRALAREQEVFITVPLSFGLKLPVDGLTLNQGSPKISTAAKDGSVINDAISSVAQVGIFYLTPTLIFDPPYLAGVTSEITIQNLSFSSDLRREELITLNLKGFVRVPYEAVEMSTSLYRK